MDVTTTGTTVTRTVDARGQSCAGPVLALARAVKETRPGEFIELLCSDPGSVSDITAWSRMTGNELVEWSEADGLFRFLIRKA